MDPQQYTCVRRRASRHRAICLTRCKAAATVRLLMIAPRTPPVCAPLLSPLSGLLSARAPAPPSSPSSGCPVAGRSGVRHAGTGGSPRALGDAHVARHARTDRHASCATRATAASTRCSCRCAAAATPGSRRDSSRAPRRWRIRRRISIRSRRR